MKKLVMIIMAVALIALPTMAQDWQSTSTLQGSGSNYSSQVTAVGATGVSDMTTTTESNSPARGPRRAKMDDDFNETGEIGTGDDGSPIGDAVLPLMLFAGAFLCMRVFLKRKRALSR